MWGFPVCWQTSTTIERKVWKVDAPGDLSGSYYTERKTWTGSLKKDGNYVLEPGSVEIWIYYLWYGGQCYRGPRGGSMAEVVIAKHGLEDVDNTIVMIGGTQSETCDGQSKWRGRVWVFPRHALHTAVQSSGPVGSRCGGLSYCIGTDGVRKLGHYQFKQLLFSSSQILLICS